MRKVLLVEDEKSISKLVKSVLALEGFLVHIVEDGSKVISTVQKNDYDLILLDLMLPGMSGYKVISGLRALNVDTPILVISALNSIDQKVKALDLGADDYIEKNFSFKELLSRIKSLLRRSVGKSSNIYRVDDLVLDESRGVVSRRNDIIHLTKTEFHILSKLISRKGALVETEELRRSLWDGPPESVISNKLTVHMRGLRKKVDDPYEKKLIKTMRGFGYKIVDEGA